MDIDVAWWNLRKAMDCKDFESARQYAKDIRDWLDRGGFLPLGFTRETVYGYARDVIRRTAHLSGVF